MNKMIHQSFTVGALIVLCTAAALYAFTSQLHGQAETDRQTNLVRHWDSLLTAQYSVTGSWEGLESLLAKVDGQQPHLQVWDEEGRLIYGTDTADNMQRIPLLYGNQQIGFFSVRADSPPAQAFPVVLAVLFFAAGILFIYFFTKSMKGRFHTLYRSNRAMAVELEEAQRRIQKLERVRSTMIADVAHELRNPLSTLRTLTENALTRGQALEGGQVAILHNEIYRMSKLINDLNQLALAESGHLRLEKTWFSLAELIQTTIEAMLPEAEERGITLEWVNESASPLLFADRIRMQQVFINLLGNALHHARGNIQVNMADSEGAALHFSVTDDGIGMEEEELPHVFDRFYRSNPRSGGLGLGLAIVKEFVGAHGGQVAVESRWNEGTIFTVTLPAFQE